jgi:hypothetical protein
VIAASDGAPGGAPADVDRMRVRARDAGAELDVAAGEQETVVRLTVPVGGPLPPASHVDGIAAAAVLG